MRTDKFLLGYAFNPSLLPYYTPQNGKPWRGSLLRILNFQNHSLLTKSTKKNALIGIH